MKGMFACILTLTLVGYLTAQTPVTISQSWYDGFKGEFAITFPKTVSSFRIILKLSARITKLEAWSVDVVSQSDGGKTWILKNKEGNGNVAKGQSFSMVFVARGNGGSVPSCSVCLEGTGGACDATATTQPSPTSPPAGSTPSSSIGGTYDYGKVLGKSILFYEAQRSGKLPSKNRISWRGDSALGDKGSNGEDLTGGWYDAGDFVKFNFPMAGSTTLLAWGLIKYKAAYVKAGELNNMLDCIKWPLDYLLKCHTKDNELYGQVGNGGPDHAYWGRPEDMTMSRPAYKLTTSKPGSDLAAETAAAMAAGSIAFKESNPTYSTKLLNHAKKLYNFADKYRGKYSDSISDARTYYNSGDYTDELAWGAAWLYKATKDSSYLSKAESNWSNKNQWGFSWTDKMAGASVLLYELTKKSQYASASKAFLDQWLPGGGVSYTAKGLAWRDKWGPLRYSANAAFLALVSADSGLKTSAYRDFAKKQIGYMLGDGGHSYVVGYGNSPPKRPHHRSSSCPSKPASCSWPQADAPGPNPQVLNGALVGGPGQGDNYNDDRKDYISNEVACDYNAGFQSALAGLANLSP